MNDLLKLYSGYAVTILNEAIVQDTSHQKAIITNKDYAKVKIGKDMELVLGVETRYDLTDEDNNPRTSVGYDSSGVIPLSDGRYGILLPEQKLIMPPSQIIQLINFQPQNKDRINYFSLEFQAIGDNAFATLEDIVVPNKSHFYDSHSGQDVITKVPSSVIDLQVNKKEAVYTPNYLKKLFDKITFEDNNL